MACQNPECGCDSPAAFVQDGKEFCGPACVRAGEEGVEGGCGCGHPRCPQGDMLDVSAPKAAGA